MFLAEPNTVLPPPSMGLIRRVEEFYDVHFPDSYVEFLENYNGAVPQKRSFCAGERTFWIERFLSMLDDDQLENPKVNWSDVSVVATELEDRLIEDDEQVGMTLIPIAQLFAGDYACLDFRVYPQRPEISVWLHEESNENDPMTTRVAGSFGQFLELLR